MSTISYFFLAVFHFLALVWATIHPDVNPHQQKASLRQIATEVRVEYRENRTALAQKRLVLASTRAADTGYWHTSGNQILDDRGTPVRIQGINWYGFETVRKVPGGLAVQDYRTILETIHSSGFNTVRIPLSNDMVEHPIVPEAISFTGEHGEMNQPLRGLNSLQILDRVIEYAGQIGLKVILDNHRSEAGDSAEQSGLWYTAAYPESAWITDWQMLARRYAGNTTVIGVDLRNEPHNANSGGACWSGCGERDWHLAAQRGGNAVLAINPRLIVFVEGVDAVNNDFYWWGGNLEGVRHAPVHLDVANQLVYSAHDYGPNEYHQKWFNGATAASLEAVFNRHWGYISREGIAPVWVGEFGTTNLTRDIVGTESGSEGQWFCALVAYLAKNSDISWTSWALNGEDANGLLDSDYGKPANPFKLTALNNLMASTPRPIAPAGPQVMLAAAQPQAIAPQTTAQQVIAPQPVAFQPAVIARLRAQQTKNMSIAYTPHLPASVLNPQPSIEPMEHTPEAAHSQHESAGGDL
ncbi:glycoside hydrolase family 5 protein [Edaphobacter flagellatus]|uniref:glycoside hydrolase family 5 protein n=1 Tax=Edaphobacter flagellatus TaxID=1933044 RepID=UPI0021B35568|nr:glycoside hydrolase family 5 protein [Edaphobacter flagellatus]